jgi:hypothetical protein
MEQVQNAGARFQSVTEAIDTTTSAGRVFTQMLGSFVESSDPWSVNGPARAWRPPAIAV